MVRIEYAHRRESESDYSSCAIAFKTTKLTILDHLNPNPNAIYKNLR